MSTKRNKLEKKVRAKYGPVNGDRLKQLVLKAFDEPWGPRYTTNPVSQPTLQDLTPNVLSKLLENDSLIDS